MPTIQFTVERDLPCECLALVTTPFPACPSCDGSGLSSQEIELTVEYAFHRGYRGARDRWGAPLEPDDPEDIEILEITPEIELTRREESSLEKACALDHEDARLAALEYRYEDR